MRCRCGSFSNPSWRVSMRYYIEGSFSYVEAGDSTFYGRGWIPARIVGYSQDSDKLDTSHMPTSLRTPKVSLNRLRVFTITTPPSISDATRTTLQNVQKYDYYRPRKRNVRKTQEEADSCKFDLWDFSTISDFLVLDPDLHSFFPPALRSGRGYLHAYCL